jgi:hypothetical protein
MSDNIITFGQRPTESGQAAANISHRQAELQEEFATACHNAIAFLTEQAPEIDHFILCGVTKNTDESAGEFHVLTSRLSVADFALAIAKLNKTLNRNL